MIHADALAGIRTMRLNADSIKAQNAKLRHLLSVTNPSCYELASAVRTLGIHLDALIEIVDFTLMGMEWQHGGHPSSSVTGE